MSKEKETPKEKPKEVLSDAEKVKYLKAEFVWLCDAVKADKGISEETKAAVGKKKNEVSGL